MFKVNGNAVYATLAEAKAAAQVMLDVAGVFVAVEEVK